MNDRYRHISDITMEAGIFADRIECLLVDEPDDLNHIIPEHYPGGFYCITRLELAQEVLAGLQHRLVAIERMVDRERHTEERCEHTAGNEGEAHTHE